MGLKKDTQENGDKQMVEKFTVQLTTPSTNSHSGTLNSAPTSAPSLTQLQLPVRQSFDQIATSCYSTE